MCSDQEEFLACGRLTYKKSNWKNDFDCTRMLTDQLYPFDIRSTTTDHGCLFLPTTSDETAQIMLTKQEAYKQHRLIYRGLSTLYIHLLIVGFSLCVLVCLYVHTRKLYPYFHFFCIRILLQTGALSYYIPGICFTHKKIETVRPFNNSSLSTGQRCLQENKPIMKEQ